MPTIDPTNQTYLNLSNNADFLKSLDLTAARSIYGINYERQTVDEIPYRREAIAALDHLVLNWLIDEFTLGDYQVTNGYKPSYNELGNTLLSAVISAIDWEAIACKLCRLWVTRSSVLVEQQTNKEFFASEHIYSITGIDLPNYNDPI